MAVRDEIGTILELRGIPAVWGALDIKRRADMWQRRLQRVRTILDGISWVGPLMARLTLGFMFFSTGRGKMAHPPVEFFENLGIPLPVFHAHFVGYLEAIGGAALILGLATRFFAAGLGITMIVALATAVAPRVDSVLDLVGESEAIYLALCAWLFVAGAGKMSLDRVAYRKWGSGSA